MDKLKKSLSCMDEAYLVTLSNKGIYKRALKDLEKEMPTLSWEPDKVTATFADGAVATLEQEGRVQQCSCPSRTVCKHIIMTFLAANETSGSTGTQPTEEQKIADFSHFLALTQPELEKVFGKKQIQQALFKIYLGEVAEVLEESVLTIIIPDQKITYKFLPNTLVNEGICSCKKSRCTHGATAVLHYLYQKMPDFKQVFPPIETTRTGAREAQLTLVPVVAEIVQQVFRIGLFRLPSEYEERFLQVGVLCQGQGLPNFQRVASRIAGILGDYFANKASFDKRALFQELTLLYRMCQAVEAAQGDAEVREIVGQFHNEYTAIPTVTLLGVGTYTWLSQSGYVGITTVFIETQADIYYTYTSSRPQGNEPFTKVIDQLGALQNPWGLMGSLQSLGGQVVSLKYPKVNKNHNISSSKEIVGTLIQKTQQTNLPQNMVVTDWRELLNSTLLGNTGQRNYALLQVERLEELPFDNIKQLYQLYLWDVHNQRLLISIPYSISTQQLILNIEALVVQQKTGYLFSGSVYYQEGILQVFPIAYFDDTGMIHSLALEKPKITFDTSKLAKLLQEMEK